MSSPLIAAVVEIIALGLFLIVASGILGYFLSKGFGALTLSMLSLIAFIFCLLGYIVFGVIGYSFSPPPDPVEQIARTQNWATFGLILAIAVVAGLGALIGKNIGGSKPGKRRGIILIPGVWLGFCFASWIGHEASGWTGLLLITLPAVAIFWLALYFLARFILPLDKDQPVSMAFRSLITFSLGTNYPYYAIEDREKAERVPGNQYKQFFADPGIFLTGPDYAVAVSDGLKFRGVRGPGVVFTHLFESIQEPMELRPQQRAYTVEAITKDGIPLKFSVFGPFQLDRGDQQPEPGKPFPFNPEAVARAFHTRPMDVRRGQSDMGETVEDRKRRRWDELYEMIGTHVMQDIIAKYTFDELCAPLDPGKDPRVDIAKEYRSTMQKVLPKYGIQIPGGGISNLMPADRELFSQRVKSWQARWRRKTLERLGAAEAEAALLIGQTRAQVQAEMIQNISEAIAEVTTENEDVILNTVALRFIESLKHMVTQPYLRDQLSSEVTEVIERTHIIGGK